MRALLTTSLAILFAAGCESSALVGGSRLEAEKGLASYSLLKTNPSTGERCQVTIVSGRDTFADAIIQVGEDCSLTATATSVQSTEVDAYLERLIRQVVGPLDPP